MRIHLLSDLHLEFQDWTPPRVSADVVVLAGDIHVGALGLYWARQHFPDTPVIYVMGNHEFYSCHLNAALVESRKAAKELDIHLLEQDELVLAGVRFLGCTLWTDFQLDGLANAGLAAQAAEQLIADYKAIRTPLGWLKPAQTITMHQAAADWLHFKLRKESFAGSTVVVTHHAPHPLSVAPRFAHNALNPAFVSNLERLLGFSELWLHGHTHDSFDYEVAGTRVVANPRGYPRGRYPGAPTENPAFVPGLVLEL